MLHNNSLVDIRPFEDSKEESAFSSDGRRSKSSWLCFPDCTYTLGSVEAGRIRSISHGVKVRVRINVASEDPAGQSQKNPGVNAGNILRRQPASRYYNSLLEDRPVSEENLDNTDHWQFIHWISWVEKLVTFPMI
ncbi:hypothetical protein INT45_005671 [Circinella minor]|uniref:Uncharacterized protein n=1 Tax=Circinella minor TaxID=1195481 RepID=A0A8H7VJR6_9FUNG|nr:hypothetical protein INT45_005671 [Circinella minor]